MLLAWRAIWRGEPYRERARRGAMSMGVRMFEWSTEGGRRTNMHGHDAVDEFNAELEQVFGAAPASFNLPGEIAHKEKTISPNSDRAPSGPMQEYADFRHSSTPPRDT
eukprot:766573-Hanusia_phi.AAC.4